MTVALGSIGGTGPREDTMIEHQHQVYPYAARPHRDPVRVRALAPDEQHVVAEVFDSLSAQARWLRFHAPLPRIPARYVDQLARVEPGRRHVAIAIAGAAPVGHGMWVRDRAVAGCADLALAVRDDWQSHGVGRALTGHLAATAAAAGIDRFTFTVARDNALVRTLLARIGAACSPHDGTEFAISVRDLRRALPTATLEVA